MKIYEFHELIKKLDEEGWNIHDIELDGPEQYEAAGDLFAMYEHAYRNVMALFVFLTFLAKSTAEAERERTSTELRRSFEKALQGTGDEAAIVVRDYFKYKAPKEGLVHQIACSDDSIGGYIEWGN